MRIIACLAFVVSFVLVHTAAMAATSIGMVLKATGSVSASGPGGDRKLGVDGDIYQNDRITTDSGSVVHILFVDQTKLVIGPKSELVIDRYVFEGKQTASSFAISAATGAFRFISGKSKKPAYNIKTRNATIGIRGTAFDFASRKLTRVLLYKGIVEVCRTASSCASLANKCDFAQIDSEEVYRGNSIELAPRIYKLYFPFASNERPLLPGFRLGSAKCAGGGDAGSQGKGEGGNEGSGGNHGGGTGGGGTGGGTGGL